MYQSTAQLNISGPDNAPKCFLLQATAETSDATVWWAREEKDHLSGSIWLHFCLASFWSLNPLPYTYLQFLVSPCWVKKTGQEFLALEVCLVTQRTREGPCVAFNSLHCLPKANLGQTQSLTAHGLWMDEWKVKYAFKCKTQDRPPVLWWCRSGECEICRWPGQQEGKGPFCVCEATFRLMFAGGSL